MLKQKFTQLWQDIRRRPAQWMSRLVFLLGPWLCFMMVEMLNTNGQFRGLALWQIMFNMIWYYIIFAVCRLAFGRLRSAATCASLFCFILGLVNHYVLQFRGRTLFPADLSAWRTTANVMGGFELTMDLGVKQALILLIAYLFLVAVCPAQRYRERLPKAGKTSLLAFVVGYITAFFFTNMLPTMNIYTEQWDGQKNGFMFNFSLALRYSQIEKPRDYSKANLEELMEKFPSVPANPEVTRPVNVIAIMNETFSDLSIYDGLELPEDMMPFLHGMQENTIRGWMIPPVIGGGTASSEFEFLTGLSNSFLPAHSIAYQMYVKPEVPAMSIVLGNQGYRTTSFHPYYSSGWNRPIVYEYMEFERQLYDVDVEEPYYIRNYISDQSAYEKIFELTRQAQGKPNFVFTVTMQNHFGYDQGWNNLTDWVELPEDIETIEPGVPQYLALIRESDNALRMLIEHYQQVEEPTMVVFFGDHQPSLKTEFYDMISGVESGEELTVQQNLQRYAVPFFIWTNYDIPEQQDVLISSNFLGALMARTAGFEQSGWLNFLSQLQTHLPVISTAGYVTPDGRAFYEPDELTEEQQQWLEWYQMLAYCGLRDMNEETEEFYHLD